MPGGSLGGWAVEVRSRSEPSTVRGAALPHQLLVPRRGQPRRGAGGGGAPARSGRPRGHRPRRLLRGRALRRCRARRRAADRVRGRAHARRAAQAGERGGRSRRHPSGGARRRPRRLRPARAARSARPRCAGRRAPRSSPWPTSPTRTAVTGSCSPGAGRARCPPRWCATVRPRRGASSSGWSRPSAATGCSWSSGTTVTRSTGTATTPLAQIAARVGVEVVATNNVHYATPDRSRLAHALAAIRSRRSLDELDGWLPAAPFAHLRRPAEQLRRFARYPGAVARTVEIARRLRVRPAGRGARPARLPGARRPHRHDLAAGAHDPRRGGVLPGDPRALRAGPPPDRLRARGDRGARVPRLLPPAPRHRRLLPAGGHLLPGAGERRRTARSATRSASPRPTPSRSTSCSSGSCRRSATVRPTSTSTSSTSGGRR